MLFINNEFILKYEMNFERNASIYEMNSYYEPVYGIFYGAMSKDTKTIILICGILSLAL